MENGRRTIKFNDLTGLGPWLESHGIPVDLQKEASGRVIGEVDATDEVFRLMVDYQANPVVHVLDFLAYQRRLRGRLLDARNGHEGNGYGRTGNGHTS